MRQSIVQLRAQLHREAHLSVSALVVACMIFTLSYLPLASGLTKANLTQTQPVISQPASKKITANTVGAATSTSGSQIQPTPSSSPAPIQSCSRTAFADPADLDLVTSPLGLTIQTDNPTYYTIYGNTASDIRSQIQRCAPNTSGGAIAEFTAQTTYRLNWQYEITNAGTGLCSLANVKVGLHTTMVLPDWQSNTSAAPGLTNRWQNFVRNLNTHEQGHVAIDQSYANQLLNDLQALPPTSCNLLPTTVAGVIRVDTLALNVANDTYDSQTGHGASQGAVLPTY